MVWPLLGGRRQKFRFGDWEQKKSKRNYEPRLYQVSDETGKLVTEEIEQYDQMCLDGDDVMILDTMNLTYVWVGADANKNERDSAEQIAQKFLKESQLPRGKTPKIEVIFQVELLIFLEIRREF